MIIVNFATDVYKRAQNRLSNSLNGHKQLMFNNYSVIGSPTHQESPYQFKIHAIEAAMEYDSVVLWCDSSLWLVGDLLKIEGIIKEKGYFMEECGHWVRDWCKPETRAYFELTSEELKTFHMFSAGLLGLDFNNSDARNWFYQWRESALHGHFKGPWETHRHDMTCGSIIAQRMGFKYERGGSHMSYVGPGYAKPEPGTVFLLQGLI
jgi:hypothetical protein